MNDDPSNLERSSAAYVAMTNHSKYSAGGEDDVVDLLTDLLHLAHIKGYPRALEKAITNFTAEIMEG